MGRYRAIMTDTDREYISGEGDASDTQRYQAVSRVRSRINDELAKDVHVLQEHHPQLLSELREIVCEPRGDERTQVSADAAQHTGEPPESVAGSPEVDIAERVASVDVGAVLPAEKQARRDAAVAALTLLREKGAAQSAALKQAAWGAYNADERPDDAVASERSLWNNVVLKRVIEKLPEVEKASDAEKQGGYLWVGQ